MRVPDSNWDWSLQERTREVLKVLVTARLVGAAKGAVASSSSRVSSGSIINRQVLRALPKRMPIAVSPFCPARNVTYDSGRSAANGELRPIKLGKKGPAVR